MNSLKKEDEERISTNIAINHNTVLQVLQSVRIRKEDGAQVRRDQTMLLLLGCIAMALNTQAEIALCTAERSSIITPN